MRLQKSPGNCAGFCYNAANGVSEELDLNAESILFKGRVQGVGFRRAVLTLSKDFPRIHGYVRNLPSGDVEVYVQGDPEGRRAFVKAIRVRFAANIQDVERTEVSDRQYQTFDIEY